MRYRYGLDERLGRRRVVEQLARWWTSAPQEARFAFLRAALDARSPTKGHPPLEDIRLAILLAEAAAGEIDPAST